MDIVIVLNFQGRRAEVYGPYTDANDAEMFLLLKGWKPCWTRQGLSNTLFEKENHYAGKMVAEIVSKPRSRETFIW